MSCPSLLRKSRSMPLHIPGKASTPPPLDLAQGGLPSTTQSLMKPYCSQFSIFLTLPSPLLMALQHSQALCCVGDMNIPKTCILKKLLTPPLAGCTKAHWQRPLPCCPREAIWELGHCQPGAGPGCFPDARGRPAQPVAAHQPRHWYASFEQGRAGFGKNRALPI